MPTPNDYTNFQFGQSKSATRQEGNYGTSGDYGQTADAPPTPAVQPDDYPAVRSYGYDAGNTQFSRDKEWEPQAQAEQADGSSFADLQQFLMNSPYTAGSRVCHEQTSGEKETWKSPHDARLGAGDGRTGPAD